MPHPTPRQLADLHQGLLDPGDVATVAAHIDECPTCRSEIVSLGEAADDELIACVRAPHDDRFAAERQRNEALDVVRRMSAAGPGTGATPSDVVAAPDHELAESSPRTIGEYEILGSLGTGGMGRVFKARHRRMNRVVALKILPAASVATFDAVKRFRREAEAAARLSHPNIVVAHDAGEAEGVHFLVMEYVEGSDLSEIVRRDGPLPWARAVDYVSQAARGLAYAHAQGIVHRDIKPSNLLVDLQGTVKILDMGLARIAADDPLSADPADDLTHSGQVMGTVDYMAPEQAHDTRRAGAPADVYGLGCTLYRLLSGNAPYGGNSVLSRMLAHRDAPIPSLIAARRDIPAALDDLCRTMLAKQPERRPKPETVVVRLEALRGESASSEAGSGRRIPPARRILAAAAGAIFVALAVWIILKNRRGEELARVSVPDGVVVELRQEPARGAAGTGTGPAVAAKPTASGTSTGRPLSAAVDADAPFSDRAAADWALAHGGTAVIKRQGAEIEIRSASLLPSGPLELRGVVMPEFPPQPVAGRDVRRLRGLKLTRLEFSRAPLADADVAFIGEMSSLRELVLFECRRITDATAVAAARCENLERLNLGRTALTDAGMVSLAKLTGLKRLKVDMTSITDDSLGALESLAKLEELHVPWCPVSGDFARRLARLPIKDLDVNGWIAGPTPLTRRGMEAYAELRSLEKLHLCNHAQLEAEWLSVFTDHPNLTTLILNGVPIGDDVVAQIEKIPNLKAAHLKKTRVSPAGIAALRKSRPSLQIFSAGSQPGPSGPETATPSATVPAGNSR